MIIPQKDKLSQEELATVEAIAAEFNCTIRPIVGHGMSVYAIIGDETSQLLFNRIEGLPFVRRVDRIQVPYKVLSKDNSSGKPTLKFNGKELGKDFVVFGGHCAIDPKNHNLFLVSANAHNEAGVEYEAVRRCVDSGVDVLQVGARNALNYRLLTQIGLLTKDKDIAVLLKRSIHMGPVDEMILAAEYIAGSGNNNIMLCPRGTAPAMNGYRNHPDESITQLIKERTWAPVVVDPSHAVGKAAYVPKAALAAAAYGADGVIIESHCNPMKGTGDDPKQAVTPQVMAELIPALRAVAEQSRKF